MRRNAYWYKVDNAGKVFLDTTKKDRSNVFRLSFYLNEQIDKDILEQAVNEMLHRFETFAVELKKGWFWYFFTANKKPFLVEEEPSVMCKYFTGSSNRGYLFKVYYRGSRITLETFHALSDGTGALEFLKSITYRYLQLTGHELNPSRKIRSQVPPSPSEGVDMFLNVADKEQKKAMKEEAAYQFKGERFADNFILCVIARVSTEQLLALTRKNEATIGEYVSAMIVHAIYSESISSRTGKKPIKLFVPVNLRKYFPTLTLRNFSLYIKAAFDGREELTFETILEETKKQFRAQLNKDELHARINATVGIEKNIIVRLLPLFIKNIGFKIGYYFLGESISTCSFSNLGTVDLPEEMKEQVTEADFSIGGTAFSALSIHGHTNLMMNTVFKDISIIQHIVHHLTEEGIEVIVDTNYQEGIDEIL